MSTQRSGMYTRASRRDFLRTAGVAAAGIGLAGGLASIAERAQASSEVTLQYWNGWTEAYANKVQVLVDDFHKENQGITVKNVPIPGSSADFNAKLFAAVAAGNAPDVVTLFGAGNMYTMADQGALLPLEEVATAQQLAQLKSWLAPAIWNLGTYNGKVYGIAQWAQSYAVLWNKTLAQEAGLPVSAGIQTQEDLYHWSQKLTKTDSHGNITQLGFYSGYLDSWLPVFGGQFTDAHLNITANYPNNVKALEFLVTFAKLYDPNKVAAFNKGLAGASDRSASYDPFLAGKEAIIVNGPWELGNILDYAPKGFQYGTNYLPSPKNLPGIGAYTYGDIASLPRGTAHPKEAFTFISYLTGAAGNHTQYANLFKVWPCVNAPNAPGALNMPAFRQETVNACPGYDKYAYAFLHAVRYLFPPKLPIAAFYDTTLQTYVDKAMLLEMSPQAALDAVQQQVSSEWTQYKQTHKH